MTIGKLCCGQRALPHLCALLNFTKGAPPISKLTLYGGEMFAAAFVVFKLWGGDSKSATKPDEPTKSA